jgi:ribosomal protein S18 acetylase RimI-like enzyme
LYEEEKNKMEILEDLSDQSMARAIEENMYAMTPLTHGWPKVEAYQGRDVSWCVTDIGFPTCNPIIRVNLKPEAVDGVLAMLTDKARKKKVNLHCWVTRDTRPANMADYLTAHGFTRIGEPACMAINLKDLNESNRAPKGFSITEVKNSKTLKTWCQVAAASFGVPDPVVPSIYDWYTREMQMEQPVRFFLGMLDGKPVATSQYFLGQGVCGLYFVGTLPEARNKGVGFSITQKPLLEAKKLGYRAAILQASKMGQPIYQKLGFKEYGKMESYSWIYATNNGVKNGK